MRIYCMRICEHMQLRVIVNHKKSSYSVYLLESRILSVKYIVAKVLYNKYKIIVHFVNNMITNIF